MERRPDVEMDSKCRRRVMASIIDWPLLLPVLGLGMAAVAPAVVVLAVAPALALVSTRELTFVLVILMAIRELMMLPIMRIVVMALVIKEAEYVLASMSLEGSS